MIICSYIFTAFSEGISEKIVNLTGLGYENRCYYDTDLNQYYIPEEFIQDKLNNKTKLFVVADIDGKMYISQKGKKPLDSSSSQRNWLKCIVKKTANNHIIILCLNN